jgi:hypothetical protein
MERLMPMRNLDMTRRSFLATLAAVPVFAQSGGWVELFNGQNLEGWRQQGKLGLWKVTSGQLCADGPMCHLFYVGPVRQANFKNFDLEIEAMARPNSNSGVYFHTAYQEAGWPSQGFEVQINNSQPREIKKTGSLYNIRNNYKPFVRDDEWFKLSISIRGKNIQVRLNDILLVDYLEPTPPVIPPGMEKGRMLGHGTFALQCHDPESKAFFRSVRVRPLEDNIATPAQAAFEADEVFKQILTLGVRGYPMLDLHVHPKGGLSTEQAAAKSRRDGIQYGLAVNCGQGQPVTDDAGARRWIEGLKGQPAFVGMQAEGREWIGMFSKEAVSVFDYVFTDSMTWTDNRGRRMRTWIPAEVGTIADPQEFMDTLVDRAVGILENEPVDIYVNPTYLPDQLAPDYEKLWTETRRRRIVTAAAKNRVAVEINNRYRIPSASFIKMAKEAGCKFTFGTNNAGANDLGRCEYAIRMIEECQLAAQDFWTPLAPSATRAVDRKGGMLKKG